MLLIPVVVGIISPDIVPANFKLTPTPVNANVPDTVTPVDPLVTPVFPNVIALAFVGPIFNTTEDAVSIRDIFCDPVYKLLYIFVKLPKLLTLVTVGFISPVIVPLIIRSDPVPVNIIVPAVVIFVPAFPIIISIASALPILKFAISDASSLEVQMLLLYKLLYKNDDVPKLLTPVIVGFISPVIVPVIDNETPVFDNPIIPAVVTSICAPGLPTGFPNTMLVALTAPIGSVVAVKLSKLDTLVELYKIQPPTIFIFFSHESVNIVNTLVTFITGCN